MNRERFILLSLLPLATGCELPAQTRVPENWLQPCERQGMAALCGSYAVWENRDTRQGRRIELNIVVLPAAGSGRLPDPVFYFAGGPGSSASREMGFVTRLLAGVRAERDLVFVDARGTGASHPLDCPATPSDAPLQAYFDEFLPDDYVRDCLARQDAEVALYTNPIAVDDIAEVRAALGYDRINLFGISGGTRSALVYMRRHPHSVRTAVLKGVAPMDMENPLPHAKALESGMRALIDACAANVPCRAAYPALADDWDRSKRRFDAGPVEALVHEPRTGRRERVRISRGTYADGVRHILYSVERTRALPGMVHAAARGDYSAFAQLELEQTIGFEQSIAYGAFLTMTCAEDVRFIDEADIARATAGTFLGDYRVRRQLAACSIWGAGSGIDADFQQPVRSDSPVLLISGEHDTTTPAHLAERVASALPNAKHVVFPNQSHDSPNVACEARLIADFIEAGTAAGLDAACASTTSRPPFLVNRENDT